MTDLFREAGLSRQARRPSWSRPGHPQRALTLAVALAWFGCNGSDVGKECRDAGGTCQGLSPGFCYLGTSLSYPCGGEHEGCCLATTPCETAGGSCVPSSSISSCNGQAGTYPCSNTYDPAGRRTCCLP